jgi:hypothetical protein
MCSFYQPKIERAAKDRERQRFLLPRCDGTFLPNARRTARIVTASHSSTSRFLRVRRISLPGSSHAIWKLPEIAGLRWLVRRYSSPKYRHSWSKPS